MREKSFLGLISYNITIIGKLILLATNYISFMSRVGWGVSSCLKANTNKYTNVRWWVSSRI